MAKEAKGVPAKDGDRLNLDNPFGGCANGAPKADVFTQAFRVWYAGTWFPRGCRTITLISYGGGHGTFQENDWFYWLKP